MPEKIAIIIGAGPAGLTAAYELLQKTGIKPVIFEQDDCVGGISRTINYKGNKIDIGGHRFFSKSDRIMKWWANILPTESLDAGVDPNKTDDVMLMRNRISRIYYTKKFFDYPIKLNWNTITNLGLIKIIKIFFTYIKAVLFPIKKEDSLKDFLINRFGSELYKTFFKEYTEKVWGVPCEKISAKWGAQRIKGLSITKTLLDAAKSIFNRSDSSIAQKKTETSLIKKFLYPKYGPGQMWKTVAKKIQEQGGKIYLNHKVCSLKLEDNKIGEVIVCDKITKERKIFTADYCFSTMPVKELISSVQNNVPEEVKKIAQNLVYRDFITIGLLVNKLKIKAPDNWIYIQEPSVKVGRIQIFNNWSPFLIADPNKIWLGLEYFANEGDDLWNMEDENLKNFAIKELIELNFVDKEDILDSTVIKVKKTYPAYLGSYNNFPVIRKFTDTIPNLFLLGRNGMHRYNNQDHSMLTAMIAVENIINNITDKQNIWDVNTEEDYHEERKNT